jgi:hypothetical protein
MSDYKDKFNLFQSKYPTLFREHPRSGFSLPDGWDKLVHGLCFILEHKIMNLPEEIRGEVYCSQVKEKFGGLRFYMNQETPYISGAIALAENMSFHICERCGEKGSRRSGGWVVTLCEKHDLDRKLQQALSFPEEDV